MYDDLVPCVPEFVRRALVAGRRPGDLAALLRARGVTEIHGLACGCVPEEDPRRACDSLLAVTDLAAAVLPFPERYFDAVVLIDTQPYWDRLSDVLRAMAPFLAAEGCLILSASNRQYWRGARTGAYPDGMREQCAGCGLGLYGIRRRLDPDCAGMQPDAEGNLAIGGRLVHVSSDQERLALLTIEYFFTAVRRDYNPLAHSGRLFDAGHPDWAYDVLSRIPTSYLEDPETCANVFGEKMICQLALDKNPHDGRQLTRFAVSQEAFYRAISRKPYTHFLYQCQAEFWHRLGNDDMAARLLRSILHVAPDAATQARLDTYSRESRGGFSKTAPTLGEETLPEWRVPERLPRVLFITHLRPHFGLDILYDGLCGVLGDANVIEFPWKPSLHGRPPAEMANYPCAFDRPGAPIGIEDLIAQLEQGQFDIILFGDIEKSLDRAAVRRIVQAGARVPLFIVDAQDGCDDTRPEIMEHVGVTAVAGFLKREMLTGADYGPNAFPLPFAYPDSRVPTDVSGPRDEDLFWAGHRTFGLRRLYLERIEALSGRRFDRTYSQEDYVKLLLHSRVGLNIFGCGFDTVRYWEIPAHGCMLLAERLPIRIPYNFRDGESAIFFDDTRSLEDALRYCVSHRNRCAEIARAGREHFLRYHTGVARARQALGCIQDFFLFAGKERSKEKR